MFFIGAVPLFEAFLGTLSLIVNYSKGDFGWELLSRMLSLWEWMNSRVLLKSGLRQVEWDPPLISGLCSNIDGITDTLTEHCHRYNN